MTQFFGLATAYSNTLKVHWCGYKGGTRPGLITSSVPTCVTYTGAFFRRTYLDCHRINHSSAVTGEAQSHAHFVGQYQSVSYTHLTLPTT